MKIPAPVAHQPRRPSTHRVVGAAALAVVIMTSATRLLAVDESSARIDVRLARVEARRAVMAFITVNTPAGVPMDGQIRVLEGQDGGQEVALIPVFSTGAFSVSIPVAQDTARHVAVCVELEGGLHHAAGKVEPVKASDCDVMTQVQPPARQPQRPARIPAAGDILSFQRESRR